MASVYLVLKLEGMNPQYCTGFENACVCVVGGRVKNWYFGLKDCLPHLFHGFRNRHFNKISLDNMLYFHN